MIFPMNCNVKKKNGEGVFKNFGKFGKYWIWGLLKIKLRSE